MKDITFNPFILSVMPMGINQPLFLVIPKITTAFIATDKTNAIMSLLMILSARVCAASNAANETFAILFLILDPPGIIHCQRIKLILLL